MKTITTILLALFSLTISYAQDGKPTKEETLQYIKSELEGKEFTNTSISEKGSTYSKEESIYTYSNLKLESCRLEFLRDNKLLNTFRGFTSGNSYKEPSVETKEMQIVDFSKTESIGFLNSELLNFKEGNEISTGYKLVGLTFKQKKDDGTYDNSVNVYIGLFTSDFQDYKSLKIYKAFQYLRKLCNAPEPISFD